ncbi:MAG: AAA family ATPase, partial [Candidatus Sericytochromatia bacterium]
NIKSWFLNRFLWSAQEGALSEEQLKNLELAKKCFGLLDGKVSFSKVIASTHDIIVKTTEGEVYFEYLSSGYKSSLFILLGLIKIIEERYVESPILIEDFEGIILIDEIDLHLHPQWQASLLKLVKSLVPNAQIIATTHSPHMIQVAESKEIIALNFDEVDGVINREVNQSEYGFQGWTVEEILEDVMGLKETRSEGYLTAISDFNDAISSENITEANSNYEVLDSMLHPNNHLRKLLKFQLASLGAED